MNERNPSRPSLTGTRKSHSISPSVTCSSLSLPNSPASSPAPPPAPHLGQSLPQTPDCPDRNACHRPRVLPAIYISYPPLLKPVDFTHPTAILSPPGHLFSPFILCTGAAFSSPISWFPGFSSCFPSSLVPRLTFLTGPLPQHCSTSSAPPCTATILQLCS